jgi:hypothetical protein
MWQVKGAGQPAARSVPRIRIWARIGWFLLSFQTPCSYFLRFFDSFEHKIHQAFPGMEATHLAAEDMLDAASLFAFTFPQVFMPQAD